jgi:sterol-4alpha-carboxylate 3-dehydrogenase (decarboxylating)
VIGGEGFLGHAIVVALSAKYRAPSHRIVSLDVVQRHYPSKDQWTFSVCDLTSSSSLVDAFKTFNVKTVFHTASPWIGAGKEVCEKVNVQGTEKVIEACKSEGVKKLVYTSSASVVHDGGDLINIDERCSIPKDQKDQYNITKVRFYSISSKGDKGLAEDEGCSFSRPVPTRWSWLRTDKAVY